MLVSVFLAVFLPCVGLSAVLLVYLCLLWYAASGGGERDEELGTEVKEGQQKGLSASDLEKLPKVTGREVGAVECAVCLDEIEGDQPARLVPGCNHGFHLLCADTWLSEHRACPLCRARIDPPLPQSSC